MKRATTLLELQLAIITGMVIASLLLLNQWARFEFVRQQTAHHQARAMVSASLQYLLWQTHGNALVLTSDSLGSRNGTWQLTGEGFFIAEKPFRFLCLDSAGPQSECHGGLAFT